MYNKIVCCCIILCSLFACNKVELKKQYIEIKTDEGPEDIVLDIKNNRILVSCDNRRDEVPPSGAIYSIDLVSDVSTSLPIISLPDIPFHPHGFDLQTINGIDYLFVINHYRDATYTNSVLQLKVNKNSLEFIKEYKHPLLISPNDLTVLPNGGFYFSNDRNSSNVLDLLLDPTSGSVVYCNGIDSWKKVDSLIAFPNGLFYEDNSLYLSTSRNKALYKYEITSSGDLINKSTLSTINGMDNLSLYNDELLVSVHPDENRFALLSLLPSIKSPSATYAIHKQTGKSRQLFYDSGNIISGASTSIIYNNSLYLAQVFDGFVLKVVNYSE